MDIIVATKDLILSVSDWIGIGGIIAAIVGPTVAAIITIWLTRKYLSKKEEQPLFELNNNGNITPTEMEETEREEMIKRRYG